ncbi:hypothetical protein [Micromonospora sp. NPDC049662]|uniref:hypothetical protein n=1 Tax=Micromonospora sp. NPDC049662 TaxID=3155397 RepID=UPI00341418A2
MSRNPLPPENTSDSETALIIPTAGSFRPGAVNVRLVCPPEVMDAALASLADFYGDAWKPSTREPAPSSDGHLMRTGTLIVPVPGAASRPQGGES